MVESIGDGYLQHPDAPEGYRLDGQVRIWAEAGGEIYRLDGPDTEPIDPVPVGLVLELAPMLRATIERIELGTASDPALAWEHVDRDENGRVSLVALRRLLLHPRLTIRAKVLAAASGGYPVERVEYEPRYLNPVTDEVVSRWLVRADWPHDPQVRVAVKAMEGQANFAEMVEENWPGNNGQMMESVWDTLAISLLSDLAGV